MKEYPEDEDLVKLEKWQFDSPQSVHEFLDFLEAVWHWPDFGFDKRPRKLYLHTGGWSGNESIIASLKKNFVFWSVCWEQTNRGGHYKFDIGALLRKRFWRK